MTEQQYDIIVSLKNDTGNEVFINPENILTLSITESVISILPKFTMMLNDVGLLTETSPITDKSRFHIILTNQTTNKEVVNADFIVSSFYMISDSFENNYTTMNISGYMYGKQIMAPSFNRYYTGSSSDVIGQMTREIGLNYSCNNKGNDNLVWYQNGSNYSFLSHVSERSFIDGDGVFVYGTVDNSITYTSFKHEISKTILKSAKYSKNRVENNVLIGSDYNTVFFNAYNFMNNVDIQTSKYSYGGLYTYMDKDKFVKENINISKKGTDYINHNEKCFGAVFTYDGGLLIDENLKTLSKGKIQNDMYRSSIFSNSIVLNINNSSEIKLFEKLDFFMPSFIGDLVSDALSGTYIVASKTYSIVRNRSMDISIMICRYGLNSTQHKGIVKDIL